MAIKKYADDAAWKAATKSSKESTIAIITESNTPRYRGVAIEVKTPAVGDIVMLDENKKIRFMKGNSMPKTAIPNGWESVGVVGMFTEDGKALVLHKTAAANKWASVYIWTISGAAMTDGESHTGAVTAVSAIGDFTWQTSNVDDFVSALNAFLASSSVSDSTYCYKDADGNVQLVRDPISTDGSNFYKASITGLTVATSEMMATAMPMNTSLCRNNGFSTYYGGANFKRFYEYYSVSGKTPTANVPLQQSNIVNKTAFETSSFCADLRDHYADYDEYIFDNMTLWPCVHKIFAPQYNDGDAMMTYLVGKQYKKKDGTNGNIFAAADYAASVGFAHPLLQAGNWRMPTVRELRDYMSNITYGLTGISRADADVINVALNEIGGSALSCASNQWSCSRGSGYSAWFYNGSGDVNYYGIYHTYQVRLVLALDYSVI